MTLEQDGEEIRVPVMRNLKTDGSVWLPTPTVRLLSRLARESGEELALTEADVAKLAPNGRHIIAGAQIVQRRRDGRGHHYVRARMLLRVSEGKEENSEPWIREVDLPVKQFGLLLEAQVADVDLHGELSGGYTWRPPNTPTIDKPRWVGSRSFDGVWEEASGLAAAALVWNDERKNISRDSDEWDDLVAIATDPRTLVSMDALERLQRAQVLSVDIDVFEGAPEWDDAREAWEFAQRANLPFDPIYLDLTAPAGLCPLIALPSSSGRTPIDVIRLHGALMWKGEGGLVVAPVGKPEAITAAKEWSVMGRCVYGGRTPSEPMEWARLKPSAASLGDMSTVMPVFRPDALFNGATDAALTGRVEPLGVRVHEEPEPQHRIEELHEAWAKMVLLCASRALAILGMLEAINIEIAEPKPTNEDRRAAKRAAKRGWKIRIAQTVAIKASKYQQNGDRPEGSGEKRVYSHAFWRRGNYAYYPLGTRIADKLAEENPADPRLVNHPRKGLCRKVFRGPVVIGRHDKEGRERRPITKTRVWRSARRAGAEEG
jgi:hypothetical protein